MKITQLTCPSCGASIESDDKRTISYCEYCGGKIAVETAHSVGYDMERGRLNARTDMVQLLAEEVLELTDPLCNLEGYKKNISAVNNRRNILSRQITSKEKSTSYAPYLGPMLCGGFMFLLLLAIRAPFGVFVFFGLATIAGFFLGAYSHMSSLDKMKEELAQRNGQFTELNQRIENCTQILSKHHTVDIPVKYRNKEAMTHIYNSLKGQGAFSIEEAISKYEVAKQQKQLMDMQAQQIELQKQQIAEMQQLRKETRRGNIAKGAGSAAAAAGTAIVAHEVIKQIRKRI